MHLSQVPRRTLALVPILLATVMLRFVTAIRKFKVGPSPAMLAPRCLLQYIADVEEVVVSPFSTANEVTIFWTNPSLAGNHSLHVRRYCFANSCAT